MTDVAQIKKLAGTGVIASEIAAKLGISRQRVYKICTDNGIELPKYDAVARGRGRPSIDGPNYLYVIGLDKGPYKVGYTKHLARRLEAIQKLVAEPLQIHRQYEVGEWYALQAEHAVHARLKRHAISAEWFSASLDYIAEIIEDVLNSPTLAATKMYTTNRMRPGVDMMILLNAVGYFAKRRDIPIETVATLGALLGLSDRELGCLLESAS